MAVSHTGDMTTATIDLTKLSVHDLDGIVRRATWEPARIREQSEHLDTMPGFAGLPADILATVRAGGLASADEIEADAAAATAELNRRARRSTPTHKLPYVS